MTWARSFELRRDVRESLWLLPLLGAAAGAAVAWATLVADRTIDMPAGWVFGPSTSEAVLAAIVGAMIGLVGFVVTVTVLMMQTAMGAFSARYLRLVYRDGLLKATIAVLVGTLAYSFVLLRRVGTTEGPELGVAISGGFVLLGIVLFLVFFSRFLQRLRPVAVASSVSDLGVKTFIAGVEAARAAGAPAAWSHAAQPRGNAVRSTRSGTIQAVHLAGLVGWAERQGCTIVFRHSVGDFVSPGAILLDVLDAPAPPDAARELGGMVALGKERTIEQDPAFAMRVMVDVAIRALSPAVNDPTTAVQVLDYLETMLLVIGSHDFDDRGVLRGSDGAPRLVLPSRDWEGYLALGVTEIRHCGATSVQVVRRLRALLEQLREEVRDEHRAAVEDELARLDASVRQAFGGTVDLERAMTADRQGMGGPGWS